MNVTGVDGRGLAARTHARTNGPLFQSHVRGLTRAVSPLRLPVNSRTSEHARRAPGARHRALGRTVALSLVALSAACSPAAFAVRERAAERAYAAADAEGAQVQATYELVLARLYLDKAREESAEAHYAWALELLSRSERSAKRAFTLSQERARAVVRAAVPPAASESAR
ncbi:MAG: hypothetical protein JWN48_5810 [Myxococcaceae bacterium]|nr:hypothetical protein [Myxococcaceae bacterium]